MHRIQIRLDEAFVILWVIFNKVSVDAEALPPTVFSQEVQFLLIVTENFCIYKCHEINIVRVQFPGNKTSVYPLMKIRANDGRQLFHVHRKVIENYLPRTGSRKGVYKLGFKCCPVGVNNLVGLQVPVNVKFQVCGLVFSLNILKIKHLNILPQYL